MYLTEGTLLQGGKYKIVRHISSGGFGNTYEGYDVSLDKKVAIKEFFVKDFCTRDSDTTLVTITASSKGPLIKHLKQKFIEEARAIAKMEHDNIIKVHALFEENGTAYYVMDYIEGESVNDLLKRRGTLPENDAVAIILKVASALDYMHKQNRYHLDVKPANIMLRKDGKVILIDFGSSKQYAEIEGENTTTLAPCYTAGFAPAEQMNPKPTTFTAATDVYALGATLYKMLTGVTPPSAIDLLNGEETLQPLPNDITENVRGCIEKAMIPQRNKRMQTIEEFVCVLKEVLDGNGATYLVSADPNNDVKANYFEGREKRILGLVDVVMLSLPLAHVLWLYAFFSSLIEIRRPLVLFCVTIFWLLSYYVYLYLKLFFFKKTSKKHIADVIKECKEAGLPNTKLNDVEESMYKEYKKILSKIKSVNKSIVTYSLIVQIIFILIWLSVCLFYNPTTKEWNFSKPYSIQAVDSLADKENKSDSTFLSGNTNNAPSQDVSKKNDTISPKFHNDDVVGAVITDIVTKIVKKN